MKFEPTHNCYIIETLEELDGWTILEEHKLEDNKYRLVLFKKLSVFAESGDDLTFLIAHCPKIIYYRKKQQDINNQLKLAKKVLEEIGDSLTYEKQI